MHVVTLTIELGQTSKLQVLRSEPAERQKYSKTRSTHFLLQSLASVGKYEPFKIAVVILVTKIGVYNVSGVSDRLLGYYPNYKHFSNEGFVLEYFLYSSQFLVK